MSYFYQPIHLFMKSLNHQIDKVENYLAAQKIMKRNSIRHLPVTDQGDLVGIITQSDMDLIKTFWMDSDEEDILVSDFYQQDPLVVDFDSSLSSVCQRMAESKKDCALIAKDEDVVGIFTWVDMAEIISLDQHQELGFNRVEA
jgi:CBS domain-containing protein